MLELVGELPRDLAAAIMVVVHTHPSSPSALPELLTKRGHLPASHPVHGEKIAQSRIYVAPPDNQLLVRNGYLEVVRGPRENGHRPAVDALFRTASAVYGPRVIGVVLTGYLDCGTSGMMSVKARGGIAVVQSPVLVKLVSTPPGPSRDIPEDVAKLEGNGHGAAVELVCPTCQGVLTEAQAGAVQQFRCHVGHTFGMESLLREQSEELERARGRHPPDAPARGEAVSRGRGDGRLTDRHGGGLAR